MPKDLSATFVMLKQLMLTGLLSCMLALPALATERMTTAENTVQPRLVYITSDTRIPFWDIMARGIRRQAHELGYGIDIYSAHNDARRELELIADAIKQKAEGLIISPTNSSAAATLIKLADRAGIPVVIADIGADSDGYISYISSDNYTGAYRIGQVLTHALEVRGWQQGRVGIIAIPQKRLNGQARTAGFMKALDEAGIHNAAMRQQVDFSHDETYRFSRELIESIPDLRALWLQGSDRYQAALDAIADTGRRGEILLVTFDAEPEFLQLIPSGVLVGAAMQQPFLMGEQAVKNLHQHLQGLTVEHEQKLPVLAISADNLDDNLKTIRRNVLGQEATP
ncbi:substrate-binding domain-containing protein [Marinobacterium sediminicola]|uniref:Monosaccharide ABC transporter substrate-binding protein, CUT2 family (TC 3.A.1.2.-) n=1 Tax=Marinobacterium sediminicola TaxID=518898 RepID=A0ABY1S2Y2_9GAMM|nr:substrate-binding domain-containing protein [Marinobacterium sediminicola]ULG69273.1 substrate-binding domain-containing protein [Marinobacterium sediminicola]SMR77622.1 monosaccharide ABC transporter substrate-binding protein, CUT2 family (TC 3.A.1.2.-) [Marinobacterium sediminicola]